MHDDGNGINQAVDRGTISRRSFVKQTTLAGGALFVSVPHAWGSSLQAVDRSSIVSALGDTLIPSGPGDPGYKDLEPHGITEEVLKGLSAVSDETLEEFNQGSMKLFDGKSFLELSATLRADYLGAIVSGKDLGSDPEMLAKIRSVYRAVRLRVLTVYYQNFPENRVPMDRAGIPLPGARDAHDIVNPNTRGLVTGWDIAGYPGPVEWEEEEQLRARMKTIRWEEGE